MFKKEKCKRCETVLKEAYSFCPSCGSDLRNPAQDERDFGVLGKSNVEEYPMAGGGGLGISDKIIEKILKSIVKNVPDLMKNFESQINKSNVEQLPNGIKIHFGNQADKKKVFKKGITEDQLSKMKGMPRVEAKSSVRRLTDKVVYELKTLGIDDVNDVFVTKLVNGYEVKAIGKNKVYVNNIPVNLPLKGYRVNEKGLSVEFGLQ